MFNKDLMYKVVYRKLVHQLIKKFRETCSVGMLLIRSLEGYQYGQRRNSCVVQTEVDVLYCTAYTVFKQRLGLHLHKTKAVFELKLGTNAKRIACF